jgi:hypothetical protein
LKLKLKYRHFNTIGATETESQAVLNTLTEQRLPGCVLKMAESLGMVHTGGRGPLASTPKVSFDQMAASVPEIMDLFVF